MEKNKMRMEKTLHPQKKIDSLVFKKINNKGDFEWDNLAWFLFALIILIVVIVLIGLFKEKLYNVFEALRGIFNG